MRESLCVCVCGAHTRGSMRKNLKDDLWWPTYRTTDFEKQLVCVVFGAEEVLSHVECRKGSCRPLKVFILSEDSETTITESATEISTVRKLTSVVTDRD